MGNVNAQATTPASNLPATVPARTAVELGHLSGTFDDTRIQYPYLQVTYGVGKLFEAGFPTGSLVLNKDQALVGMKVPLRVIVLTGQDFIRERLTPDQVTAGVNARTFADLKGAADAGLRITWEDDPETGLRVGPEVTPTMRMRMLIRRPDKLANDSAFMLELPGGPYAVADFVVDKDAYEYCAKPLLSTARLAELAQRCSKVENMVLYRWAWDLWTDTIKKRSGRTVLVPKMKLAESSTSELIDAIRTAFSPATK